MGLGRPFPALTDDLPGVVGLVVVFFFEVGLVVFLTWAWLIDGVLTEVDLPDLLNC
jgi:hypothetical protein